MTGCSQCGDCCESIFLSSSKRRMRYLLANSPTEANRQDAEFILKHWHGGKRAKGGGTRGWSCDAFDPDTRLCTAHATRPPVCSGYPWYGRQPVVSTGLLEARCTYVTRTPVMLRSAA